MIEIEKIPAKPKEKRRIRVAAYARVSSDKDAAFHSLEAQRDYYERYVSEHPDFELVGIYSDNGISGTIMERPEFQRMLNDCRNGMIDLVVSKSITRFARNTVILLETVRELKRLGIDCYFEKEDLHSMSADGELLMTLLAMYAEEEARSASENQKWRIQKLYESGKPAGGHTYGFRLEDGKYVIVPEEAEVVRRVFSLYLEGKGLATIANILNNDGIPARYGGTWSTSSLRDILVNEKYAGDLVLQKNFREDFRTKKKRRNRGEMRKVIVHYSHEPIVERRVFEEVQEELKIRGGMTVRSTGIADPAPNRDDRLFTGLIRCMECGATFQLKYQNKKQKTKPVWICHKHVKYGKGFCDSQMIPDDVLVEKTKEVLEIEELTSSVIRERILRIDIPERFHMVYNLTNGDIVDVPWEHKSRSLSWTAEMREKARQAALERARKQARKPARRQAMSPRKMLTTRHMTKHIRQSLKRV